MQDPPVRGELPHHALPRPSSRQGLDARARKEAADRAGLGFGCRKGASARRLPGTVGIVGFPTTRSRCPAVSRPLPPPPGLRQHRDGGRVVDRVTLDEVTVGAIEQRREGDEKQRAVRHDGYSRRGIPGKPWPDRLDEQAMELPQRGARIGRGGSREVRSRAARLQLLFDATGRGRTRHGAAHPADQVRQLAPGRRRRGGSNSSIRADHPDEQAIRRGEVFDDRDAATDRLIAYLRQRRRRCGNSSRRRSVGLVRFLREGRDGPLDIRFAIPALAALQQVQERPRARPLRDLQGLLGAPEIDHQADRVSVNRLLALEEPHAGFVGADQAAAQPLDDRKRLTQRLQSRFAQSQHPSDPSQRMRSRPVGLLVAGVARQVERPLTLFEGPTTLSPLGVDPADRGKDTGKLRRLSLRAQGAGALQDRERGREISPLGMDGAPTSPARNRAPAGRPGVRATRQPPRWRREPPRDRPRGAAPRRVGPGPTPLRACRLSNGNP